MLVQLAGKAASTVATAIAAIMETAAAMDANCATVKIFLLKWRLISNIAITQSTSTATMARTHPADRSIGELRNPIHALYQKEPRRTRGSVGAPGEAGGMHTTLLQVQRAHPLPNRS
jgi:hypothetical protein